MSALFWFATFFLFAHTDERFVLARMGACYSLFAKECFSCLFMVGKDCVGSALFSHVVPFHHGWL